MNLVSRLRLLAVTTLALCTLNAQATDYDNPLAAIAANPQLSDMYALLKKTGYAEPLGTGGDVTFLALSNRLLGENAKGMRFTNLELFRDKIPPEAMLQILQALTLDGQFAQAQFDELVSTQGSGKAIIPTVLGKDAKYKLHRGKDAGTFILEDIYHNGMLINTANAVVTQNGMVIVVDANAVIPK